MAETYKLSLFSAIIINLNIMLGVGIFLNCALFAQQAGVFGFVPYLTIGILLIPLIIAMAALLNKQEDGTFYGVAYKELGKFWGFLSTWSYFIAKPASAGVMITFFCDLLLGFFPGIPLSLITCTLLIVAIFVFLNLFGMRIGRSIQMGFIILKLIPILFIILVGFWFLNPHNFVHITFSFANTAAILPMAIYAFAGFEASFSLNRHIENAQRNAPRAIIVSYLIVICTYLLYQSAYYGALNLTELMYAKHADGILLFLNSIYTKVHPHLQALFYLCVGTSALGGAYGILFSNMWNLHELTEKKLLPYSQKISHKNNTGIAYWCLFAEAALCTAYIVTTHANKAILQQVNAFGCTLTYTISTIAFAVLAFSIIKKRWARIVAIFALCTCMIFIISCINGFRVFGPTALFAFTGLLIVGAILFNLQTRKKAT